MQYGIDFAGIKEVAGIEGAFQALLVFHIVFCKHFAHQIAFFDTNPVFAGQHAANLDTQPENIGTEFFSIIQFTGHVRIKQYQRMQIAVAGVEDIGNPEAVFFRQFLHAGQHIGQLPARDGAVHAKIIG